MHAEKNKAGAERPAPRSLRLRVQPRLLWADPVREQDEPTANCIWPYQ